MNAYQEAMRLVRAGKVVFCTARQDPVRVQLYWVDPTAFDPRALLSDDLFIRAISLLGFARIAEMVWREDEN